MIQKKYPNYKLILLGILFILFVPTLITKKNSTETRINVHSDGIEGVDANENDPKMSTSNIQMDYSSYYGGNGTDQLKSIDMDNAGNIYAVGSTNSKQFPVTAGANDTSFNGAGDAFIIKFQSNGSILYCTYLGGTLSDEARGIHVRSDGSVIITGITYSSDFPITSNAFNKTKGSLCDGFLAIINPAGSVITYSTFFGGFGADEPMAIDIDATGNIYITGTTTAGDFPTTLGAYDRILNGSGDIFVSKFTPNGSSLLYSTYIGGSDGDYLRAMTVDINECIYLTGSTLSSNFPLTSNATNTVYNSGEAYLVKLNAKGSALYYSSFIGGSSIETGWTIKLDETGNIYLGGHTMSSNFPVTTGSYDTTYNNGEDAFLMKLSPDCITLNYSMYIGGSGHERIYNLFVDLEGYVYFTGSSTSNDYPTTNDAFNVSNSGSDDIIVTRVDTKGDRLLYSSYIGGNALDRGQFIIDSTDCIIVLGISDSSNYPCTLNAYNSTLWEAYDFTFSRFATDLEISHPDDGEYEYGTTGNTIVWTVQDSIVGVTSYQVYCSGVVIAFGIWVSGTPIVVDVDGLKIGTNYLEIIANNGFGNYAKDRVSLSVYNNHPNITSPMDVNYTQGTTGHLFWWILTDISFGATNYTIYQNNTIIQVSSWENNDYCVINIDNLAVGNYLYSIKAFDGLGGNITDSVEVVVKTPIIEPINKSITDYLLYMILGGFFLGVVIMHLLTQRKIARLMKIVENNAGFITSSDKKLPNLNEKKSKSEETKPKSEETKPKSEQTKPKSEETKPKSEEKNTKSSNIKSPYIKPKLDEKKTKTTDTKIISDGKKTNTQETKPPLNENKKSKV